MGLRITCELELTLEIVVHFHNLKLIVFASKNILIFDLAMFELSKSF